MATILIIEDDIDLADTIQACIQSEKHTCYIAESGETGLRLEQQLTPDLIILDLGLPGIDGLEVCRDIRRNQRQRNPYILMLTARQETQDCVLGIKTGADDYLKKPFSPEELIARIYALLRRDLRLNEIEAGGHKLIRSSRLRLDLERHEVLVRSSFSDRWKPVAQLSRRKFNLLALMAKNPGRVWEFNTLLDRFWENADYKDERQTLQTCISQIRASLSEAGGFEEKFPFIKNVSNVGYRFEDDYKED